MSTAKKPSSDSPLRPLSRRRLTAASFKMALHGETVLDSHGKDINLLYRDNRGINVIRVKRLELSEWVRIDNSPTFPYPIVIEDSLFNYPVVLIKVTFSRYVEIESSEFRDDFIIDGATFQEKISFSGGTFNNGVEVLRGSFLQGINISGGDFKKKFKINNGDFFSDINLKGGNYEEGFQITGCVVWGKLNVLGGDFGRSLSIHKGIFADGIFLKGGEFRNIRLVGAEILSRLIKIDMTINYDLYIASVVANELNLSQRLLPSGQIYLKNISVSELKVVDFFCLGKFIVLQPTIGPILRFDRSKNSITKDSGRSTLLFQDSDVGSITFLNTQFTRFSNIIVENSRLSELISTNTHFPISSEHLIYTDSKNQQDPFSLEALYYQLYTSMKNHGNRSQELKYHTEYLEWHRKAKLKELKRWYSKGKSLRWRIWNSDWYTPASLWLHKFSSGYGNNWVRSALMMLGVGLLWYIPYVLCLPDVDIGWSYFNPSDLWNSFVLFFGYFWSFLLPTHRVSFIPGFDPGSASLFFDFLGRVSVGFMLYQTIAAFRRFGKR